LFVLISTLPLSLLLPSPSLSLSLHTQRYCGFIPAGQLYGDYISFEVNEEHYGFVGSDGWVSTSFLERLLQSYSALDNDHGKLFRALRTGVKNVVAALPTTFAADKTRLATFASQLEYTEWVQLVTRTRFKAILYSFLEQLEVQAGPRYAGLSFSDRQLPTLSKSSIARSKEKAKSDSRKAASYAKQALFAFRIDTHS